MGLTIKNFNIFGVSLKNSIFRGAGVHEKPNQREAGLKRGAWTVCRFEKGGLARKKGVVLLREFDTRIYTMFTVCILITLSYAEIAEIKLKFFKRNPGNYQNRSLAALYCLQGQPEPIQYRSQLFIVSLSFILLLYARVAWAFDDQCRA